MFYFKNCHWTPFIHGTTGKEKGWYKPHSFNASNSANDEITRFNLIQLSHRTTDPRTRQNFVYFISCHSLNWLTKKRVFKKCTVSARFANGTNRLFIRIRHLSNNTLCIFECSNNLVCNSILSSVNQFILCWFFVVVYGS